MFINENINFPNNKLELNFTERFLQKSREETNDVFCPISTYKISKVYDKFNDVNIPIEVYNSMFDLNKFEGIFKLKK